MGKGCQIIHENCDPKVAQDRSLPYNTFLIEYLVEGKSRFDIASGNSRVDIFDDYWDKYSSDFRNMTQTEGRVNPKLWQGKPKAQKPKAPPKAPPKSPPQGKKK